MFKVATAEGELTNISKCVAEDDGFHINGSLVVAPDFFIRNQIEMLKVLVSYCEGHIVLIMCPVPRYATFRCCDDPGHCTNFDDPSYLSTLISDLACVKASIVKGNPEAMVVDTLEALIGQGNKSLESKEEVVKSCWSQDPVHANLHAYFKLASNTIQMIEGRLKTPSTSGGKRQRTDSNEDQHGSGSGSGIDFGSGSGSGIDFGSGSGHGSGAGIAAKRQKYLNRHEQRGGDGYGMHGHFEGNCGGSGGGGTHGTRGGGRHEYRNDKGGYYGSGHSRQQKDDYHLSTPRRFQRSPVPGAPTIQRRPWPLLAARGVHRKKALCIQTIL